MGRFALGSHAQPVAQVAPFVCLVLAGMAAATNPLALAASGMAINVLSPLAGQGWRHFCASLGTHGLLAEPLQGTLVAAYRAAVDTLVREWDEQHPDAVLQQLRTWEKPPTAKLFAHLRTDAEGALATETLEQTATSRDLLELLGDSPEAALAPVAAYLDQLGEEFGQPGVAEFLRRRLPSEVARRFADRLYTDDPKTTPAWRAYLKLSFDGLRADQERILDLEERILQAVETFGALPAELRNPLLDASFRTEWDDLRGLVLRVVDGFEAVRADLAARFADTDAAVRGESAFIQEKVEELKTLIERALVLLALDRELGDAAVGAAVDATPDRRRSPPRARIFEVPHRPNPHFRGRRDQLDRLAAAFDAGAGPAVLAQAIQGLGGVGKTQLAARYAHEREADYAGVWWVQAEGAASLAAGYAALAARLGLPLPDGAEPDAVVAAVRGFLEGTAEAGERWLLVFDNAVPRFADGDTGWALDPYLPRRGRCDVLITSRERDWRGLADPLDVDVLPLDEAAAFLLERTGQGDEAAARELAKDLGCLPLALEQAGAYVADKQRQDAKQPPVTLADYLVRFRERPFPRLERDRPKLGAYEEVVATTWIISFGEVERRSEAAADLFTLCAFLAPEGIPLDDLVAHAGRLPERLASALRDPDAAVEAVDLLLRFSLAEAGEGRTLNVHRLVQLVAREWLPAADRREWAVAAAAVMQAAFPYDSDDVRTWPACARLLSHAQAAAGHAADLEVARGSAAGLLNQAGVYLRGRAQFAEARAALENALAIREAALGPDHPDTATSLGNLAGVLRAQGDLAGARTRFERALQVLRQRGPEDDEARLLRLVAGFDLSQGRLSSAVARLRAALRIDQALGLRREEADDFLGLANAAAAAGRRPERRDFLLVRWLILRDLGDPGAEPARRDAEKAFGPQVAGFDARTATIEASYGRDGGRRMVEQAFRRL
jgi:Tfp pilus assembly protein PilF